MVLHQTLLNGCSRGSLVTKWPPGKICGRCCFQTMPKFLHQVRCSRRSYQSLEASLLPSLIAYENFILTETFVNEAVDTAGSSSRTSQAAVRRRRYSNKRTISTWAGDDGTSEDSLSPKIQCMGPPWNKTAWHPNFNGIASHNRPSPDSIWGPSRNSTNPARLTPLDGDGNAMLSNAVTDSGYASAFHLLLPLDTTQLGCVDEKALPSSDGEGDEGVEGDEAKTTYSAATTVSQADARHYISELSHEIAKRLSTDVDVKELASLRGALPELIKGFSVKLGLESASQINRDIMYFVHKHHR